MIALRAPLCLLVSVLGSQAQTILIDGQLDANYGPPVVLQLNATGYGDNTDPDPLAANGSEIDAAYASISGGMLRLIFTGNLETNFNKLNIFIDSLPGGQNTLASDNPDIDFNQLNNLAGLTFDSGFEADFHLSLGGGGDPVEFFANYAELGNPGVGLYLGSTGAGNTSFPVALASGVELGIDNSNLAGVSDLSPAGPAAVATGIEWSIPLGLIGNPAGRVRICSFISNPERTNLSNQVLGSLPAGSENPGSPAGVDFSTRAGSQFFQDAWEVSTTADSGPGSLRQVISDAAPGATVTFAPALPDVFPITLTSGQLQIDKDLTIDASDRAEGITIDAGGSSRIMGLTAGHTVVLDSLTLTGGAVPVNSDPGGAIHNQLSDLTLNRCTLFGNSARFGGAIFNLANGGSGSATLTLDSCTVTGNFALEGGGAIYNYGGDGPAAVDLHHCTVHGNTTDGTGGGVFNGSFTGTATLTLANSLVAGNAAAGTGPDIDNLSFPGTINPLQGVSLLSDLSGSGLTTGSQLLVGAPLLAPLSNYGGPSPTLPPLPGSPAINAAGTSDPGGTDQRGAPRFADGALDIGAAEFQPAEVDTPLDQSDSPEGPELSLREAIAREFVSTITFDPTVFDGEPSDTITLGGSQLQIARSLRIDASSLAEGIVIDAAGNSPVMRVNSQHLVSLDGLTIRGGNGGGINSAANLTLSRCTLSGNTHNEGGGINHSEGTLTLNQCTLTGNSARYGGGIFNEAGTLTLSQVTISGNSASENGGGITNLYEPMTLANSIVAGNTTPGPARDIESFSGGSVSASGVNLLSSLAGSAGLAVGPNVIESSPLLAPLGGYGGATPTMPPLPGSPAVEPAGGDAASPFGSDQRGASRITGSVVDIGAVEAVPLASLGLTDTDSDGIADLLEGPDGPYPHLTIGTDDSAVDTDGDGTADAREIAAMTNLFDSGDFFRILSIAPAPGFATGTTVRATLPTFPGLHYGVSLGDLLSPFGADSASSEATGFTTTLEFNLPAGNFARAFSSTTPVVVPP